MAYATAADFEDRHGPLESGQETIVDQLLADASVLIASEVEGSEETWVDETDPAPAAVVQVAVAVAYRAWSNPDSLSRASVADVSVGYRGDMADALYLTKAEKRIIRRLAKRGSFQSLTMVSPYPGSIVDDELEDIVG